MFQGVTTCAGATALMGVAITEAKPVKERAKIALECAAFGALAAIVVNVATRVLGAMLANSWAMHKAYAAFVISSLPIALTVGALALVAFLAIQKQKNSSAAEI